MECEITKEMIKNSMIGEPKSLSSNKILKENQVVELIPCEITKIFPSNFMPTKSLDRENSQYIFLECTIIGNYTILTYEIDGHSREVFDHSYSDSPCTLYLDLSIGIGSQEVIQEFFVYVCLFSNSIELQDDDTCQFLDAEDMMALGVSNQVQQSQTCSKEERYL